MTTFALWLENDNISAIVNYLKGIEQAGYYLLVHQTDVDSAMKIIKGQDFSQYGLEGTSLVTSSDSIKNTFQNMNALHAGNDKQYQQTSGGIHKQSNAILVMAFPKNLGFRRITDMDGHLADLHQAGKIRGFGLPNQYIVGFWRWDGQFFGNGKFNPTGIL